MNSKLKEFNRENIDRLLRSLPVEERLKGVSAEDLRNHLPVEERLKGVSAEDVLKGLSQEALQALIERLKTNPTLGDPN